MNKVKDKPCYVERSDTKKLCHPERSEGNSVILNEVKKLLQSITKAQTDPSLRSG